MSYILQEPEDRPFTDAADRLCMAVHGRRAGGADLIDGSECRLFVDALAEIERLRAALREIAGDDLYLIHASSWHDTGHMMRGVQAIARRALEGKDD